MLGCSLLFHCFLLTLASLLLFSIALFFIASVFIAHWILSSILVLMGYFLWLWVPPVPFVFDELCLVMLVWTWFDWLTFLVISFLAFASIVIMSWWLSYLLFNSHGFPFDIPHWLLRSFIPLFLFDSSWLISLLASWISFIRRWCVMMPQPSWFDIIWRYDWYSDLYWIWYYFWDYDYLMSFEIPWLLGLLSFILDSLARLIPLRLSAYSSFWLFFGPIILICLVTFRSCLSFSFFPSYSLLFLILFWLLSCFIW